MPFVGKDFIILGIAVPLKHFIEVIFNFGLCFSETIGARGVGNSPELAFHCDIPVFIRHKASFRQTIIQTDDVAGNLLIRNGLRSGETVLLAGMG